MYACNLVQPQAQTFLPHWKQQWTLAQFFSSHLKMLHLNKYCKLQFAFMHDNSNDVLIYVKYKQAAPTKAESSVKLNSASISIDWQDSF